MKAIQLILLLAVVSANIGTADALSGRADNTNAPAYVAEAKIQKDNRVDPKYLGYTIDGVATASQLAAQRSHTVSGKDERNFAVFTGITVILIIYFFTQFKFFDK